MVLSLLAVLSDETTGLSLVSCHSQFHCLFHPFLSRVYVTNFASVHIVACLLKARGMLLRSGR
jgi:hypothetical protein